MTGIELWFYDGLIRLSKNFQQRLDRQSQLAWPKAASGSQVDESSFEFWQRSASSSWTKE